MRFLFTISFIFLIFSINVSCSKKDSPLENACKEIVIKQLEYCANSPISQCGNVASNVVFLEYPTYFTPDARVELSRMCNSLCVKSVDIKPTIQRAYNLCISGKVFSDWFVRNKIKD